MLDIRNNTTKDKNITVSSLWNRILKIWDMLFELMQIDWCNKNYFTFFCNVKLGLWKGRLTWNKKSHAQNQEKNILKIIFKDIWSVNNPIQTAAFIVTYRDFVLYWSKLFDFEGSNIP